MNAPTPKPAADLDDDEIDLGRVVTALADHKWLIAAITAAVTLLGAAYAFLAKPVYEANLLVQVEDSSPGAAKGMLAEAASMFDVKTEAAAEIEILRSRKIVGQPVDQLRLYIQAEPRRFPIIGDAIARRATDASSPGLLSLGSYTWGAESIDVDTFDTPPSAYGESFRVVAGQGGAYTLHDPTTGQEHRGQVGQTLQARTVGGQLQLLVNRIQALPGASFKLKRYSRMNRIEDLQDQIKVAELGKRSGVINVSLRGTDVQQVVRILNTIGTEYVRQNIERKSEEAEKTLQFLDTQLPALRKELETTEAKYNAYRNERGVIDLGEEAKALLGLAVTAQTRVVELQQKRLEVRARFQAGHPGLQALDEQIAEAQRELDRVNQRIRRLPLVEQDALRLTRDMKVSTDLYASLLESSQQLKLVKAGKTGNVRIIDSADVPDEPEQPKKPLVVAIALVLGLLLGCATVLVRRAMRNAIESAEDLETSTGVPVYATVPQSRKQQQIDKDRQTRHQAALLALTDREDFAVEALSSFMTALQFAMVGASNNIVLLTGATPGVGKSFVSANFAAVLAREGKRVLLIDGDLRKGYLQEYFDTPRERGLSEMLAGQTDLAATVRRGVAPNLDFVPTGTLPPNPTELLRHARLQDLLEAWRQHYDIVLIDTAPVLPVSDTAIIAPHVGSTIIVVRDGQSSLPEVRDTVKRLGQVGVRISCAVFNGMKPRRHGYGYSYGYGYGIAQPRTTSLRNQSSFIFRKLFDRINRK